MAGKKSRTSKTSKGIHGAKKYPLDRLTAVLMGKGQYAAFKPIGSIPPSQQVKKSVEE